MSMSRGTIEFVSPSPVSCAISPSQSPSPSPVTPHHNSYGRKSPPSPLPTPSPGSGSGRDSAKKAIKPKKKDKEYETDCHRLQQRAKQIAYGENTQGFKNLQKILEKDPTLLKGCLPVKPSIHQKCSKRSWDGQIRKWRRALHMYDFVDFGESLEQSEAVRKALIEQTKNPLFSPSKGDDEDGFYIASPKLKNVSPSARCDVKLPEEVAQKKLDRVRYTAAELFALAKSPLIAPRIQLPETLQWLDKRVDLEDEMDDEPLNPATPSRITPSYTTPFSSPSPYPTTPTPKAHSIYF